MSDIHPSMEGDSTQPTTRAATRSSSGLRFGRSRSLFIHRSHSAGEKVEVEEGDGSSVGEGGKQLTTPKRPSKPPIKLPSLRSLGRRGSGSRGSKAPTTTTEAPSGLPPLHHVVSTPALFFHGGGGGGKGQGEEEDGGSSSAAGVAAAGASAGEGKGEERESWLRSEHITAATVEALEVGFL